MPKVSVLTPVYNTNPQHLREMIESILNQTFTDFEFLILNDSPDNKEIEKIVLEYAKKDKRIKYSKNDKNMGITPSRNKLLKMAKGEYIALMDSDDISLPTRFEKQIAYMDTHPECGVLGTSYHQFGTTERYVFMKQNVSYIDMLNMCCVANPSAMVRRELFVMFKLKYRTEYPYAEDYDMWARMIQITQIHNLPDILLKYRWHGENVSINHCETQFESTQKIKTYMLNFLSDKKDIQKKLLRVAHDAWFVNPMCLSKHMLFHHPIKYFKLKKAENHG